MTASAASSSFAGHLSLHVLMQVPTVLMVDVNYLLLEDACSATSGKLPEILLGCPESFDSWKRLTLGDLIVYHCQGQCLLPFIPRHIRVNGTDVCSLDIRHIRQEPTFLKFFLPILKEGRMPRDLYISASFLGTTTVSVQIRESISILSAGDNGLLC